MVLIEMDKKCVCFTTWTANVFEKILHYFNPLNDDAIENKQPSTKSRVHGEFSQGSLAQDWITIVKTQ